MSQQIEREAISEYCRRLPRKVCVRPRSEYLGGDEVYLVEMVGDMTTGDLKELWYMEETEEAFETSRVGFTDWEVNV